VRSARKGHVRERQRSIDEDIDRPDGRSIGQLELGQEIVDNLRCSVLVEIEDRDVDELAASLAEGDGLHKSLVGEAQRRAAVENDFLCSVWRYPEVESRDRDGHEN